MRITPKRIHALSHSIFVEGNKLVNIEIRQSLQIKYKPGNATISVELEFERAVMMSRIFSDNEYQGRKLRYHDVEPYNPYRHSLLLADSDRFINLFYYFKK